MRGSRRKTVGHRRSHSRHQGPLEDLRLGRRTRASLSRLQSLRRRGSDLVRGSLPRRVLHPRLPQPFPPRAPRPLSLRNPRPPAEVLTTRSTSDAANARAEPYDAAWTRHRHAVTRSWCRRRARAFANKAAAYELFVDDGVSWVMPFVASASRGCERSRPERAYMSPVSRYRTSGAGVESVSIRSPFLVEYSSSVHVIRVVLSVSQICRSLRDPPRSHRFQRAPAPARRGARRHPSTAGGVRRVGSIATPCLWMCVACHENRARRIGSPCQLSPRTPPLVASSPLPTSSVSRASSTSTSPSS